MRLPQIARAPQPARSDPWRERARNPRALPRVFCALLRLCPLPRRLSSFLSWLHADTEGPSCARRRRTLRQMRTGLQSDVANVLVPTAWPPMLPWGRTAHVDAVCLTTLAQPLRFPIARVHEIGAGPQRRLGQCRVHRREHVVVPGGSRSRVPMGAQVREVIVTGLRPVHWVPQPGVGPLCGSVRLRIIRRMAIRSARWKGCLVAPACSARSASAVRSTSWCGQRASSARSAERSSHATGPVAWPHAGTLASVARPLRVCALCHRAALDGGWGEKAQGRMGGEFLVMRG